MHRTFPFLVLWSALLAASAARAAEMPIAVEPLVHEREGAVRGCGARLTGGEAVPPAASVWFDVSFNVFRGGVALVQAYAYEIGRSDDGEARPKRVPIQSAWLKGPRGSARLGENTDRREALIYPLAIDDAEALFAALSAGQVMTVGIKRWGHLADSVYTGTPAFGDEGRKMLADCLARLTE